MNKELRGKLEVYKELTHYADIEAKGFLDVIKSLEDVWCVCSIIVDPETKEEVVLLFHDYPEYDNVEVYDKHDKQTHIIPERVGTLIEGLQYWKEISDSDHGSFSIHNACHYDMPLIQKVSPKLALDLKKVDDTFVRSKVQWQTRPNVKGAKSPHGLTAYGIKAGIRKPPITDWTTMNPYKLHRVVEDVKIQKYCTSWLDAEAAKLKQMGIDMSWAINNIEKPYAVASAKQERNGIKADKKLMESHVKYLDKTTRELEDVILPLLPPTVYVSSEKITRKEFAGLMGYKNSHMKDTFVKVKKDGVMVDKVVKAYHKPCTNFTRKEVSKHYSGYHIVYGDSPTFLKKRDLTAWIKENHPDTKPKDWDIEFEEKVTPVLNKSTCDLFGLEPEDTDIIVGAFTRVKFIPSSMTQHEVVKGFLIKEGISWVNEWNLKKDADGKVVKADFDMEVRYPKKAAPQNQLVFKVKRGEAIVTSPKIGEKEYEQLDSEVGRMVGKYNTLVHRRRYLLNPKDPDHKGLLSYIREDGRIGASVNNSNTASLRATHGKIVNLPADGAVFGSEMRECLIAEEGNELVGIDQKSSQLSIAAFVANNTEYYQAVASGVEMRTDADGNNTYVGESAHCLNSRYFLLVTKEEWEEAVLTQHQELIHSITLRRKKSKGLSFASLFGCGAKKLAVMGGFTESDAEIKRLSFLEKLGLAQVIEFLEYCKRAYKRGRGFYSPTAFGYYVYCEGMHKSVNYLIQSIEAAVQKIANKTFWRLLAKYNKTAEEKLQVMQVLDYHDEVLFECPKGQGAKVGQLMMEAYTKAGELLHRWYVANIQHFPSQGDPLVTPDFAGGFEVGQSYAECH